MFALHTSQNDNAAATHAARHSPTASDWRDCLAAVLDELDYGLLMVDGGLTLRHANFAARARLGAGSGLGLRKGQLCAHAPADEQKLARALQDATQRGLRCLLRLGEIGCSMVAAVVPLPGHCALLVLPRPEPCGPLALEWFCRHHELTLAEQQVLKALCAGDGPGEVARQHGVALCTVRTQISSIRHKTGARNVGAVLRLVASLPPSVGALRESALGFEPTPAWAM